MKNFCFFICIYLFTTIFPSLLTAEELGLYNIHLTENDFKRDIENDMEKLKELIKPYSTEKSMWQDIYSSLIGDNDTPKTAIDKKWKVFQYALHLLHNMKHDLSKITDKKFKENYDSIIEQKTTKVFEQMEELKKQAYTLSKDLFEKGINALEEAKKEKQWEDSLKKDQEAIAIFEKLKKRNQTLYRNFLEEYKESLNNYLKNAKELEHEIKRNNSSEYRQLIASLQKLFEKGKAALQNAEQANEETNVMQKVQKAINIFIELKTEYKRFYENNKQSVDNDLEKAKSLKSATVVNLPEYKSSETLFQEGVGLLQTAKEMAQQHKWKEGINLAQQALEIFEQIQTEKIHQYFHNQKIKEEKDEEVSDGLKLDFTYSIVHRYIDKSKSLIFCINLISDINKIINKAKQKISSADNLVRNEHWKDALYAYEDILQNYKNFIAKLQGSGQCLTHCYGDEKKQNLINEINYVKKQIKLIKKELEKESKCLPL